MAISTGTKTASFLLTTTTSNNLVIVQDAVGAGGADCTNRDVVSDSSGLTWTYRASVFAYASQVEEWYAESLAPLSSDAITVNFCANETGVVVGYGISGVNLAIPFDLNPSLPARASGASDPDSISVSTASQKAMVLGLMFNAGGQGIAAPSSFTNIYSGVVASSSKDFAYGAVSSSLSNFPVTWTNTQGNTWLGLVDAVQGAVGTTTTTTTSTTTSTSPGTLALDGSGNAALQVGSSMASFKLTTGNPKDLIIVQDAVGAGGADCAGHDTISDSAKLVWHYRASVFAYANQVEEWYAKTSAQLASDSITVHFCASETGMVVGYGISGVNLAAPFDLNPSVPQALGEISGTSGPMTLTLSTSSANTMLVGAMSNMGGQGITPPASFREIYNAIVPWDSKDFSYGILSSSVTNYAVTWGNAQGNNWLGLVDAVQGATSTTTTTTSTSTTTSSTSTSTTTISSTSTTSTRHRRF